MRKSESASSRRSVSAGRVRTGRALLSPDQWQGIGEELHLCHRELELIQHIFDGKKLAAIARDMGLSLGTVKTYSQRIHHKLQVSDQSELILAVMSAHCYLCRLNNGFPTSDDSRN